jgi:hypothetical protein
VAREYRNAVEFFLCLQTLSARLFHGAIVIRLAGDLTEWPSVPGRRDRAYNETDRNVGRRHFLAADLSNGIRLVAAAGGRYRAGKDRGAYLTAVGRRSMSAHCYGWHFAVGFTRCSVDATIIGSNLSSKQTGFFGARRMGDLSEPRRTTSAFGTSGTRPNICDPDEKQTSTRRPGRPSLWRLITGDLGMKALLRWAADNNVSKAEAARRLIEYALEHRSRRTTR